MGTNVERNFIAALIAIGAIVISITSFNYFFGSDKEIEIPSAGLGAVIAPEEALNLLNKALIENDKAICDEIQDANLMEQCKNAFTFNKTCDEECENKKIFNLAIIKNNESLCTGITDEKIKEDCNNVFNKPFVNETKKVCDEACKDQEFFNLALIKHNSSICLQIADSLMKNQCEQILAIGE